MLSSMCARQCARQWPLAARLRPGVCARCPALDDGSVMTNARHVRRRCKRPDLRQLEIEDGHRKSFLLAALEEQTMKHAHLTAKRSVVAEGINTQASAR